MSSSRSKTSILDKPLSKGKGEVSLALYALLFSEIVQLCQLRSHSIHELQTKLSEIGHDVGTRLLDLYFVRERNSKREIKLLNMLLFVKSTLWKVLFGKEADKLEHANDDERTYYIIEKDALRTRRGRSEMAGAGESKTSRVLLIRPHADPPHFIHLLENLVKNTNMMTIEYGMLSINIVNKFISVPKDKGSLNCATFNAGIIEAVLTKSGFPAKVTAHWHKGTTYMVKFEDSVIARDKSLDDR